MNIFFAHTAKTLADTCDNSSELIFFPLLYFSDGYTVSDVVMYWRDQPVVGVEKAELPQFTIKKFETNERKIKLATGMCFLTQKCKNLTESPEEPKTQQFLKTII